MTEKPLTYLNKPLYEMTDEELHELLDKKWYPSANNALDRQRKIWDYSYIAYKGIMLYNEINRKRRTNGYGIYVNVPRTFATIEGVRKNFNISQLKIDIEKTAGMSGDDFNKHYKIRSFLNYDLDRSGTRDQIKQAGFDKLLYGNGFLYSFLMNRNGRYGKIIGDIDPNTGRVKIKREDKASNRYYGMVARRISPYAVFPDPDGTHFNVDNTLDRICNYVCLRTVKHIASFRRDWQGIIPDKILDEVEPGGRDMTNYESVKELADFLFDYDNFRYPGTVQDFVSSSKVTAQYNKSEYVEERIWLGEDFLIVQAGKGAKICLVSCNPNPEKRFALEKLDNVIVPGELWGMGEPYILRYQQIEENRIHNSVLDLLHFNISGMLGINAQYLEDPTDLEYYPGKVWKFKAIPGTSINDVLSNFQSSPAAIMPALRFMQEVKQTGQQATSITDFVTGASKSIADTATEANRLSSASDITIVDKIREMVSGAMINVCKNWLAQYPIVYEGKKLEMASAGQKLYFVGKKKENVSEKELKSILDDGYEPEDIIFEDDLDISNPKLKITGDIEISKDVKFRQWVAAIDFSNNINKVAFETGDPRRIDTIKMGQDAMANFDVISDPSEYLMEGQQTRLDQMRETALAGAEANNLMARQQGGRPEGINTEMPLSEAGAMNSNAQPTA